MKEVESACVSAVRVRSLPGGRGKQPWKVGLGAWYPLSMCEEGGSLYLQNCTGGCNSNTSVFNS